MLQQFLLHLSNHKENHAYLTDSQFATCLLKKQSRLKPLLHRLVKRLLSSFCYILSSCHCQRILKDFEFLHRWRLVQLNLNKSKYRHVLRSAGQTNKLQLNVIKEFKYGFQGNRNFVKRFYFNYFSLVWHFR